ncbi:MAG: MBL fold metallo-hydrolase [Chloroflexi bacterium]|nr:MBL fold metallo-hydrolase [Chloroflexota bacterium]
MTHGHVPEHAALPPPTVEEVSPGVFAYIQLDGSWFLNNAGFIVGPHSVIAVDTLGTEKRARAFADAVRRASPHPVQALINTHSHGDHTHGNFVFSPQTAIVAHDRCREEVKRASLAAIRQAFPTGDFGEFPIVPPMVTFSERLNVYAGDLRIELMFVGPAHTTNDVVAWIPERRVLFTGDLVFNGGTPFAMAGSIAGWLDALAALRALGAETIVPGHGPVCGPEAFDAVSAYLRFVAETASRGFGAGLSPLELARQTELGPFAGLTDPERIAGNLHRAYSELRGEPRGAPLDVPAVFADMVAYNGGQPLRCLA